MLVHDLELLEVTSFINILVTVREGETMSEGQSGVAGNRAAYRITHSMLHDRTVGQILNLAESRGLRIESEDHCPNGSWFTSLALECCHWNLGGSLLGPEQ